MSYATIEQTTSSYSAPGPANYYTTKSPSPQGCSPTVDTNSKVRDGIEAQEKMLEMLHQSISNLENRLETVLTPQPPTVSGVDKAASPAPVASYVNNRLAILQVVLVEAIRRIESLSGRVEV